MNKTTPTQKVEAGDKPIMAEISLTGQIDKIEQFKGYIKVRSNKTGWIGRFPPSIYIIRPHDKNQAKLLFQAYKNITKQKLGSILEENWRILEKFGYSRDKTLINQFKNSMNLSKLTKKELIALLQEKLKED